jgi:hypothetical protein
MNIAAGIIAGFVATLVLSALMVAKAATGVMPGLDMVAMLARLGAEHAGLPRLATVGWLIHFFIGTIVWGLAFAATARLWPSSSHALKGLAFAVVAWLLMMATVMPLAGAGWFGLNIGPAAPVAALVLHLVFGAVLGAVYGWTVKRATPATRGH